MKITLISDLHTKHNSITKDIPGGDLIICAGDISSMGYQHEIKSFCEWFDGIKGYDKKIFIAGNHDYGFETNPSDTQLLLKNYPNIIYLQDEAFDLYDIETDKKITIYGSPWQPRFYDWAFNADRGEDIKQYWDKIPMDTDILITHGPAYGFLDQVHGRGDHLGCEELTTAIARVKPKIHVCGHIHSGHGHTLHNNTNFFNAAVLNESYMYAYGPTNIDWNPETNEINFL
jgi:Icc-related predicted phosphoesterase